MRRFFPHFLLAIVLIAAAPVHATEPVSTISTGWSAHTAVGGKDAVSYYSATARQNHAVADGTQRHAVRHLGADWYFASAESAARFAANPSAYVPQYNGHCANALALGEGLIRTRGEVWEFFGDKLHLFFAERGRQRWLAGDWKAYAAEADAAWHSLRNKP
jgi:YHS domain-containing protein